MAPASSARLQLIRHVALDMDGTIYCGDHLFAETLPFLEKLRSLDIGYTFLTNNSSKSVAEYLQHLAQLGLVASRDDIFTSAHAAIELLQNATPRIERIFVVGTAGLHQELEAAGLSPVSDTAGDTPDGDTPDSDAPDAVLIGFDTALNYDVLCKAAYWIARGVPYYATHPDRICPTNRATIILDCGAVCAALEAATGRRPISVAGKPEPAMLAALAQRLGLQNNEIAMVGDRLYTDVLMARRADAMGILTLTGETQLVDLAGSKTQPNLVVNNLAELGTLLSSAQGALS